MSMLFIFGMHAYMCAYMCACMLYVYIYMYSTRVHTFDPDKGKSMQFLSRVHSRRAPPTVLNLMELEYMKMRGRSLLESSRRFPGIFANFANRSENSRINSYLMSHNGKNAAFRTSDLITLLVRTSMSKLSGDFIVLNIVGI